MAATDTTQPAPPEILTVNPDGIPQQMRERKRWVVWEAKWIPERGKYDKRPIDPSTLLGASTRNQYTWGTFEQAMAAYQSNPGTGPGKYAGIGFALVKGDGIFCADTDKCMPGGQPDERARDIVSTLNSFTEYSPSGGGLHTWGFGEIEDDCASGIEVYQGNAPRYVTVTGRVLAGAPSTMRKVPQPVLQSVIDTYGNKKSKADVIELMAPEILDPLVLPGIEELELPYAVRDFLTDGDRGTKDRSLLLITTAVALHKAGLTSQEVFSIMVNNPHSFGAALEKRNGDDDKAIDFIWQHQVQKAKAKADSAMITLDDFPELEDTPAAQDTPDGADMFEDVSHIVDPPAAAPKKKFAFLQAALYSSGMKPTTWLVRNVLPKAEVGVVFGPSGGGKSFFILDLCMAIARGERWRNISTAKGRVAYVAAEGARGFKLRLDAYAQHHGIDLNDTDFYALPAAPNLLDKADTKELIASLKEMPPMDVIVIDTMAQVSPGADENSGQDMGRLLAHCKAIHRATGAMVILVGHTGKDESRGIRGWSGIKGALDVEIEITRSLHYRAATITKMKDGTGEGTELAFKLEVIKLGEETDQDGEVHDITSCVLVETTTSRAAAAPPKGANERLMLGAIEDLLALPGDGGVDVETAITTAADKKPPPEQGKKDQRRKDMRRALDSLVAAGRVKVEDGKLVLA